MEFGAREYYVVAPIEAEVFGLAPLQCRDEVLYYCSSQCLSKYPDRVAIVCYCRGPSGADAGGNYVGCFDFVGSCDTDGNHVEQAHRNRKVDLVEAELLYVPYLNLPYLPTHARLTYVTLLSYGRVFLFFGGAGSSIEDQRGGHPATGGGPAAGGREGGRRTHRDHQGQAEQGPGIPQGIVAVAR